jgi:hypothetical protein
LMRCQTPCHKCRLSLLLLVCVSCARFLVNVLNTLACSYTAAKRQTTRHHVPWQPTRHVTDHVILPVCRAFPVVWGVATLPLSEVVASPSTWGERQQLELRGHRLAGKGATLEVQLFLSTVRHHSQPCTVVHEKYPVSWGGS